MAYVGDVIPYERRQPILGRYLTGQILGQLSGQAMGGVLGDLMGWRNVFFVLSAVFALATAGLVFELIADPLTREPGHPNETTRGFIADYAAVLTTPFRAHRHRRGLHRERVVCGAPSLISARTCASALISASRSSA